MKRIFTFLLAGLLQGLALFPAGGCGGGASQAITAVFFPENVGDQRVYVRNGDLFTQTVEDQIEFSGLAVLPFVTRNSEGQTVRTDFYGVDQTDGIVYAGFNDLENDSAENYAPPLVFPPLAPGGQATLNAVVAGTGAFASVTHFTDVVTFDGFEPCDVPAGSFSNCAKFTNQVTHRDAGGNVVEEGTFTQWLVSGVGNVQLDHTGLSTIPDAASKLVSAVVDGQTVP